MCWFCHFFSDSSENRRFLRTPPWKHYEPVAPRTQHASTAALCRKPALQLCWRRTVWHTDHVSVNKMQLGLFLILWLGRDCCVTSGSVHVQKDEVSPWWQEVTSPAPWWRLSLCQRGANTGTGSHSPWKHLRRCRIQSCGWARSHPAGPGMTLLSGPCLETPLAAAGSLAGFLLTHSRCWYRRRERKHGQTNSVKWPRDDWSEPANYTV